MGRETEQNKEKQTQGNKQREKTKRNKHRQGKNKGHLHWVKEEEHDEEGDRGPKGKTHRLHAVQGCHTVLSPAKYILDLDFEMFFTHCIFVLFASFWIIGDLIFFGSAVKQNIQPVSIITSVSNNKCRTSVCMNNVRRQSRSHLVIFSFKASLRACAQCAHMGQFLQGGKNGRLMSFFF